MMAGTTDKRIANMDEQIALPRKNGELVFEAPWQARAFGLAVALNEKGTYRWSAFSQGLAREIAAAEATGDPSSYYQSWLATLESLVIAQGLVTREELDAMAAEQALHDDHHDHTHHHYHDGMSPWHELSDTST
jgi:nitrile hydratase accessory protein